MFVGSQPLRHALDGVVGHWHVWSGSPSLLVPEVQPTPYAIVLLAAVVLAAAVAGAAWRRRDRPGARALAALAVGAGVWSGGYGLELSAPTLSGKLLFSRLLYVGVVIVPVAWIVFAVQYAGHGDWLTRRRIVALALPAAVTVVLVWTTEATGLVWSDVAIASAGPGGPTVLAVEYGPAFWAWVAYAYGLLAGGSILVVRGIPRARLFRVQTLWLLAGVAAPWVTNAVYLVRLVPLDLTPLGFVVAAVAVGAAFLRFQLLDVVPVARVARDELVEQLPEAVVAVDDRGRVVDLNPSAASVLGTSLDEAVGAPVDEVAPAIADRLRADAPDWHGPPDADPGGADEDVVLGDPPRRYELRVSPLRGNVRSPAGRLVTLRDVTERRRRQRELAVLNRILRHDVRNDVSTIAGCLRVLESDPGNPDHVARLADAVAGVQETVETVEELERHLDAGEVRLVDLDAVPVVAAAAEAARRTHPDATVETALPTAAPVRATDLLRSAIDNLVRNAIDHHDRPHPHVRVAIERTVVDGDRFVDVIVADDGPGLPPQARRTLDTPPDEIHASGASGLGLWLVAWIVADCGGEVHHGPNDPRGTVVRLRLRAADDPDATAGPSPTADSTPACDDRIGTGTPTGVRPGSGRDAGSGSRPWTGAGAGSGFGWSPVLASGPRTASRDEWCGPLPVVTDPGEAIYR